MKLFFYLIIFLSSYTPTYSKLDSSKVNPHKLSVVLSSGMAVLAGSYIYVQNSWWSDQSTSFHFDDGSDPDMLET